MPPRQTTCYRQSTREQGQHTHRRHRRSAQRPAKGAMRPKSTAARLAKSALSTNGRCTRALAASSWAAQQRTMAQQQQLQAPAARTSSTSSARQQRLRRALSQRRAGRRHATANLFVTKELVQRPMHVHTHARGGHTRKFPRMCATPTRRVLAPRQPPTRGAGRTHTSSSRRAKYEVGE